MLRQGRERRRWRDYEVISQDTIVGTLTAITQEHVKMFIEDFRFCDGGGFVCTALLSIRDWRGELTTGDDLSKLRVGDQIIVMTAALHPPALVAIGVVRFVDGAVQLLNDIPERSSTDDRSGGPR
jgi:hypothetical protein